MSKWNRTVVTSLKASGILLLVQVLVFAPLAEAKIVKSGGRSASADPDLVFDAIAQAWENENDETLAKLVHQDGVRVWCGDYDRFTNYSPNQAFYYFRNQFRQHPTVSFEFTRLQEQQSGSDRVHGMVVWQYRRPNVSSILEMRLVLVLTRQGDQWRLSEINTITAR